MGICSIYLKVAIKNSLIFLQLIDELYLAIDSA